MRRNLFHNILMPIAASISRNSGWKYYHQYIGADFESYEQKRQRQWKKLKNIIEHAFNNVPFYNKKLIKAGIKPSDINTAEDLLRIPITTKKELRENFPNEIIAKNYCINRLRFSNTSGTSGSALFLVHDHDDINYKYASKLWSRHLMGSEIGDTILRITPNECQPCLRDGRSPAISLFEYLKMQLTNNKDRHQAYYIYLENSLINPILHKQYRINPLKAEFTKHDLKQWVEIITKKGEIVITGYPLYLYFLADYIKENKIRLNNVKLVDLTAGLSTQEMRKFLAEQFNAPVFQIYGGCEFGRFAASCSQSNGLMHTLDDQSYIEFLTPSGKPSDPEELSNVIVTSLTSKALPFIRYEHGDVGRYYEHSCKCQRTARLMDIEGRLQDLIVTKSGRTIPSQRIIESMFLVDNLKLFQLIQKNDFEFEMRIVKNNPSKQINEHLIKQDLAKLITDKIQLTFKYRAHINPAASGKYRLVISSTYERFRCNNSDTLQPLGNYW